MIFSEHPITIMQKPVSVKTCKSNDILGLMNHADLMNTVRCETQYFVRSPGLKSAKQQPVVILSLFIDGSITERCVQC